MPLTQAEKDRLKYLQDKHSPKEPVNSAEGSYNPTYNPSVPTNYPAAPYKAPPELTWDQQLGNVANAVARGLEPYAAAAGTGAAVGSIGGGVGAIPGALVGAGTLALGDLGAFGYNAIAPMFNGQRITSPSDLLRQGTDTVGLTKVPDDPLSRMAYTAADFAGGSVGGAPIVRGAGQLISRAPGAIGAVGNFLRQETPNAVLAGSGLLGGAVTQGAVELGAPDYIATPLGILASLKGGKYAERLAGMTPPTPRAYTSRQLQDRATADYDIAHGGVSFSAPDLRVLTRRVVNDAISPSHPTPMPMDAIAPEVSEVLSRMNAAATRRGTMPSRELDYWRQELNKVIQRLSGPERAVGARIVKNLDDATSNISSQPFTKADLAVRNEALARARESAGTGFRTASLEDAVGGTKDELRRAARAFVNRPDFNQVPTVTQDLALKLARMPNGRGGTIKTATDLAALAARVAAPGALSIPIEVAAQTTKKLVAGASQNKATRQFLNLIDQVSRGRNATIPSQPEAQKAANYVLTTISPSGRIDERRKEDEKRKSDRLAKILAQ